MRTWTPDDGEFADVLVRQQAVEKRISDPCVKDPHSLAERVRDIDLGYRLVASLSEST